VKSNQIFSSSSMNKSENSVNSSIARMIKKKRVYKEIDENIFKEFIKNIEPDWMKHVSYFTPTTSNIDKGIFWNIQESWKKIRSKNIGIETAKKRGLGPFLNEIDLPRFVQFKFYKFSLLKYLQIQKKMVLILNEIALLNLIGCVVKGLLVCYNSNLPHGNLSIDTIYKSGKFCWQITPPIYSRNNLHIRQKRIAEFEEKELQKIGEDKIQERKKLMNQLSTRHLQYLLPNENPDPMQSK
jgi:hypothetical protein